MTRSKTYSAATEELRAARGASPLNQAQLAKRIKLKSWEIASALTDGYVGLEALNKIRAFFELAPLTELPRKAVAKQVKQPAPEPPPPSPEAEAALPVCAWDRIAEVAAELGTAAADFQFATELLQDAEFRLRAVTRKALAAGIAIVPALTGGGDKTLKASKHTTQFFRLLSVGGALK